MVRKKIKGTKTEAGEREVMLLSPAIEALLAQKEHTYKEMKYVLHNPEPIELGRQSIKLGYKPQLNRGSRVVRSLFANNNG